MTFYNIMTRKQIKNNECDTSFDAACARMGVDYKRIVVDELRLDDISSSKFDDNSLLYRMSTSLKASAIESVLLMSHPTQFTSIHYYRSTPFKDRPFSELSEQMGAGLNVIPTSLLDETWLAMSEAEVGERVNKIGGFPVVVKTLGLSHGQGVKKVDSAPEFAQLLREIDLTAYTTIARKYLAEYRHYRLIVIENEVVAAIEYHKPENDFRTNASTPVVSGLEIADIPEAVLTLAIKSANLRTSLLAGVDVLVDQTDNVAYLAEVNAPCYFARAEKPTGIDIAGKIIEAMQAKQAKENT
jgi:hypothetical protein